MNTIVCHYILLLYYWETKLHFIVSNSIVLLFITTYVVRLQLDSVFKDVSCEVGFLKDFIKCSLVLRNTRTKQGKYKVRPSGLQEAVR